MQVDTEYDKSAHHQKIKKRVIIARQCVLDLRDKIVIH